MEASSEDCCVKVAVNIRPLIGDERLQGCKQCVTVVPGQPQIQIGPHSFTFDFVYGESGSSSTSMFEECVAPLVEGLFKGYNATVLAYGQTGSGKTYTMGTGFRDGCQTGLIPQVMNALFNKIECLKHQTEFQLHVSFIEILKEEVRDLLDTSSFNKSESSNGLAGKIAVPGRSPIQIREASNGVIMLAGLNEVGICTLKDMASCLERGSLSRATGSTNMNNQSSRSHAIFTITLEQMRQFNPVSGESSADEDIGEEYLCAKLHLVDLAGSERAKRTGSDGLRLKEGIHINKGLLALGNVISALGDEKKQKEGLHVPYRDSKLTRILQDSLGGNSKTVMIACISPADINAEETLNTLKYANRARNIQNKPTVNRELISNEMQKMRHQLEYLQAELSARGRGISNEVQVLKERIAWLEAANKELCQELHEYRSRSAFVEQCQRDSQEDHIYFVKRDGLKRGSQSMDSSNYPVGETIAGTAVTIADEHYRGIDEEVEKEREHELMRTTMDKELNELNERLEKKESEMKLFQGSDTEALKQHFKKRIVELEEEKRNMQEERDHLLVEIQNLAAASDGESQKMQHAHRHRLKALEVQILDLKKTQESQVKLLKQKKRTDEMAKRLQDEIQCIKAQKVHLQQRMKQEAEQFRQWKASREKELLQLRKEGRRSEFERHKLQALNQRQKMVLQRKTEEAAIATKRLKELLQVRKSSARNNLVYFNGYMPTRQSNEKTLQRWLDHELEVMVNMHAVRFEYEKQSQLQGTLVEELALLKQVDQFSLNAVDPSHGKNGHSRVFAMSPKARTSRIASVENMLSTSSNALIAMASQLSQAEERQHSFTGRGRWNQLCSVGDAKKLLQCMFNAAIDARCRLWEKELEIKEMKEQLNEQVTLLRQSEAQRKEILKEQTLREQSVAVALATSSSGKSPSSLKHFVDDTSGPLSPVSMPAQKQLKYTPGIANGSVRDSTAFLDQPQKMVPIGHLSVKKLAAVGQAGKLWRWKRSHHQWLLQFKWKWQKPWKLSEWIKHSDETIMRSRPSTLDLTDVM